MKRIMLVLAATISIHYTHITTAEAACPPNLIEFNQTRYGSFDQVINDKSARIMVVDFYSNSCGPCKQLAPRIKELAQELLDVKFVKVNVSTNKTLADKYRIRSIPQLLFFKDGNLQKGATLCGNQAKGTIKRAIDKLS